MMARTSLLWVPVVLTLIAHQNQTYAIPSILQLRNISRTSSGSSLDHGFDNNAACDPNVPTSQTLSQNFGKVQPKIDWSIEYRRAVSHPCILVENPHPMLARNASVAGSIAPTHTSIQKHGMSLVVSGVIGALCALIFVLVVGTIILVWRRCHHQRRSYAADTERSSYISYYSSSEHTIPSFAGLGSFSAVRGPTSSGRSLPLPSLRTQTSIELEGNAYYASVPPRSEESTMSIPDNLYMPVPVETSPAAESSHVCTTPGGDIRESPVVLYPGGLVGGHGLMKSDVVLRSGTI
ncbi:hypothetical protein E4T56_gene11237 [Termitomyces sp. T112]|nr:hypothetical protein E4T56_gene11237 [Termitomyces sp. T112]KAH0583721.1 hypothetical protein H2248_009327 [Termitomyces sp. 'cryptogamus']